MQIAVVANAPTQNEFTSKAISTDVQVQFVSSLLEIVDAPGVLFYLLNEEELTADIEKLKAFDCPVFVNAVISTLDALPVGFTRMNGWPGFLLRETIEIAASDTAMAKTVFEKLGWNYRLVADVPGFIAGRVIAMIINEAYFALGDEVSSKQDIDIAMKLGTNYPYGPFEWGEKIGLQNIARLLENLEIADGPRYSPAPLLIKEISL